MNENINGVIVDGKVYELIDHYTMADCEDCCFATPEGSSDKCPKWAKSHCGAYHTFKFSQTLTDKLNGNENN